MFKVTAGLFPFAHGVTAQEASPQSPPSAGPVEVQQWELEALVGPRLRSGTQPPAVTLAQTCSR